MGGGFVVLAEALAGSIAFQDCWIDPLPGAEGANAFARTLHQGGIVVVVILTALMLPVLELEAVTDEYAYVDRIFGDAARWLRSSAFVPALLALGFASGFIHYCWIALTSASRRPK